MLLSVSTNTSRPQMRSMISSRVTRFPRRPIKEPQHLHRNPRQSEGTPIAPQFVSPEIELVAVAKAESLR
jgi:hypothetical protein